MPKKKDNLALIMEQGKDLIEFYRNNPCIAAYELLAVDLAPIQRVIFEDMWFKDHIIVVAARGLGKTFLNGLIATLSALLYPGYRVGLICPSFRQSKMIFSEIEKLYNQSSILRESCAKKPIRQPDSCHLTFKSISGANGSFIEALPLGVDGAKIRGSRFYLICIDELAQVPDTILDMVVRPMSAVKMDPMKNVRKIAYQKRLIESGLATQDDFEKETVNKMVMTSSGFYKFNHMYRRMKSYWDRMEHDGDNSKYSVYQIPYYLLPEGFMDAENVKEAERVMSSAEFRMEYMAEMISDSEGFFKASLINACTSGSNFSIQLKGDKSSKYILGVDPNQAGSASCGMVVVKLGQVNHIVNVFELKRLTTQGLTKAVQDACKNYNVVRIFMDKGGGGKALCDLLEEGYGGEEPIIDRTNEEHKHMEGRHILEMINFNSAWISDANFGTLSLLEDRRLLFPEPPTSSLDLEERQFKVIEVLKKQMLNIVVTSTTSGNLHFDTPRKWHKKDLYSAVILAGFGVRIIEKELEDDGEPILFNSSGMVRTHGSGDGWNELTKAGATTLPVSIGLSAAILKRRIK